MNIQKNTIAVIDFTLSTLSGQPIDTETQFFYFHGQNHLLPGMEEALKGKKVGDDISIEINPEKAFGVKSQFEPIRVTDVQFGCDFNNIFVGMSVLTQDEFGSEIRLFVQEVNKQSVCLSRDHPLAGESLIFNAKVYSVRPSLDGEMSLGSNDDEKPTGCACC